jgi:hypothetical protein
MPAELVALSRLTEDVIAAMHAAERPRPRHRWRRVPPLALALIALVVPSALAVRAVVGGDRVVDIPSMRHARPGAATPTGATVAIARGTVAGYPYTFAAARCGSGSTVSLITAFEMRSGMGVNPTCPRPARPMRPLTGTWEWSPGQTWFFGVVRHDVATVELSMVRQHRLADGRHVSSAPVRLRVPTRPLDPAAVHQGNLPAHLRLFVVYRPYRAAFDRIVARDHSGHVVATCPGPCP